MVLRETNNLRISLIDSRLLIRFLDFARQLTEPKTKQNFCSNFACDVSYLELKKCSLRHFRLTETVQYFYKLNA